MIWSESKHAWLRVPLLRLWSDCPHLNKAKTHFVQAINSLPVLVETCCNPNGVFELQSEYIHFL